MAAGTLTTTRRRSKLGRVLLIVVLAVVVLIVAFVVVAEFVLRSVVDRSIAQHIDSALPAGTTGSVQARAQGLIIPQLIAGSLDDVQVTSDRLSVQGVPLAVSATAHGLPVSGHGSIGSVDGSVTLAAGAVHDLARFNPLFADMSLHNGAVGITGSTNVIGVQIDYAATGTVAAQSDGKGVTITPKTVTITNSTVGLDINSIPGVSNTPIPVCTAQFLPASMRIASVRITAAQAEVRIRASGVPLDPVALRRTGSCS
ncbi:LmeA family phospholipid-binding protein [Curtobacterium ammoniigenes]|uniref:LmeA family phospholipid-binding protein n=1 Tax=Curtobacterium ammoniigenes TaxID=395387 RepID=UPI00083726CE|nr:LmeA family phospholipid-binding protein [Curtobacterium ammoniigenes]